MDAAKRRQKFLSAQIAENFSASSDEHKGAGGRVDRQGASRKKTLTILILYKF